MTERDLQEEKCARLAQWCNLLTDEFPNSDGGLAHIVVSDHNFDDEFVQGCLDDLHKQPPSTKHSAEEIAATIELLEDILHIPESDRIWPENKYYDDNNEDAIAWSNLSDERNAAYRQERIDELEARRYLRRGGTLPNR